MQIGDIPIVPKILRSAKLAEDLRPSAILQAREQTGRIRVCQGLTSTQCIILCSALMNSIIHKENCTHWTKDHTVSHGRHVSPKEYTT